MKDSYPDRQLCRRQSQGLVREVEFIEERNDFNQFEVWLEEEEEEEEEGWLREGLTSSCVSNTFVFFFPITLDTSEFAFCSWSPSISCIFPPSPQSSPSSSSFMILLNFEFICLIEWYVSTSFTYELLFFNGITWRSLVNHGCRLRIAFIERDNQSTSGIGVEAYISTFHDVDVSTASNKLFATVLESHSGEKHNSWIYGMMR